MSASFITVSSILKLADLYRFSVQSLLLALMSAIFVKTVRVWSLVKKFELRSRCCRSTYLEISSARMSMFLNHDSLPLRLRLVIEMMLELRRLSRISSPILDSPSSLPLNDPMLRSLMVGLCWIIYIKSSAVYILFVQLISFILLISK